MPPVDDTSRLDELIARMDELERRLFALEHLQQTQTAPADSPAISPASAAAKADEGFQPNLFSLFGRAVLGIAGAYLLRAAAESGLLPSWLAVALAIGYAAGWLVWAALWNGKSQLVRATYSVTSALILVPMLWEVTVRFRLLNPAWTAALLAGFASLAMALAWRPRISVVVWVGTLAAMSTALPLMAATRDPLPFSAAVAAMWAMAEIAACAGRWRILRGIVAVAADLMVVILLLLLGDASAIPPEYRSANQGVLIAIALSLFVISFAGVTVRSLILRLKITSFEAAQFAVAALVAGWGVLRITAGEGLHTLGAACLVAGAASYFAAFGMPAGRSERRNFYFYAVHAAGFVTVGSFFALAGAALAIWLCVVALAASGLGVRARSPVLDVHGMVYLCGAAYASGLLGYAGRALADGYPAGPGALMLVGAATSVACAAMVSRYRGEHAGERVLRLLPASVAVFAIAGLAVGALARIFAGGGAPTLPELAVVRTVVTCGAAVALAFAGARWERRELVWMAYAAAVLGSVKLVFEDLRLGTNQSLAASLVIYGAVLILIPRMAKVRRRGA